MVESVKTVGLSLLMKVTPLIICVLWWATHRHNPIYLLDFATYKPPASWKVSQEDVMEIMRRKKCFTQESLDFMERILTNSGTGPSTAWPPGILKLLRSDDKNLTADQTEEGAREEAEAVIYGAVQDVLDKTGVKAKDIDILIINCSLFSPTPSLCAMVRPPTHPPTHPPTGCSTFLHLHLPTHPPGNSFQPPRRPLSNQSNHPPTHPPI